MKQAILDFAKSVGYTDIEYIGEWNGYKCYEGFIDGDEIVPTGLPLIILYDEKAGVIRMSTPEEAMAQLASANTE